MNHRAARHRRQHDSANAGTSHSSWRRALAEAVSEPDELLRLLGLDRSLLPDVEQGRRLFSLRVPHSYLARMRHGDPNDPLLRQVLPVAHEAKRTSGFRMDPVGDMDAMTVPGVLHKYRGRVLLVATGACAVHCRYCFRRHFPYRQANAARDGWQAALDYLRSDTSIREVILSGGDPLMVSDRQLASLVARLEGVDHIERLRLHTRLPVVLPERVDSALLGWLEQTALQCVVVIHSNHANELAGEVATALTHLRQTGATLLNQAVLLRGVNDTPEALAGLSESLFAVGVLPYYLHLLDPVQGAAHFQVEVPEARRLLEGLRERLPGYLVPRLVQEVAGAGAKQPIL